jgi:hypothetical protein
MISGAQSRESRLWLPWHFSGLPGVLGATSGLLGVLGEEVDNARDVSWRGNFVKRLYLPAKPSHVGIDVDGLDYPLHRSTTHSY